MILAGVSAHVCVFGALMFPVHEPAPKCLLLLSRCRGAEERVSIQDDDKNDACDESREKPALCSNHISQEVPEGVSKSQELSLEDTKGGSRIFGAPQEPGREYTKRGNLVSGEQSTENGDHDVTVNNIDKPEEQTLLPRKTGSSSYTNKDHYALNSRNKHAADIPDVTESPFSPPAASSGHFGSRISMNKISQHLCSTKTQTPHEFSRQFSSSAQNVHRPMYNTQDTRETLARSLLNVEDRGSQRGSRLDLRTISAYSSVQSLYSLGLPSAGDFVAMSADDEDGEVVDGGDGDGCSDLAIFRNIPFLFLCLNLILSNMAIGIFNIHLPAFSQEVM